MKHNILLIGLGFLILLNNTSCRKKSDYSLFPASLRQNTDIKYTQLHIDTIILQEKDVESSQMGFSGINYDNDYYFVDSRFCWYYTFDLQGNFKHRYLGTGGGPQETTIGKIAACALLPDTCLFLFGHQLDHYIYDKNFRLKKRFFLIPKQTPQDITKSSKIYTHQYTNLICRTYQNKAYFNMYAEHSEFNYLDNLSDYLNKCNHISEVDLLSGKDGNMYATGYPPVYKESPYHYVIFSAINFDIDSEGSFYVSYEADSLIYKYNSNFQPICSFGFSGKNMDRNYERINNYKDCRKYFRKERKEKGYYDWIEYVNETNLLFRSYKKGIHDSTDGLQIYRDMVLLADIPVPKNFKIAGYVAPYYYSQAIADEEKEELIVYRFKLR
jgi:hypothetical protein